MITRGVSAESQSLRKLEVGVICPFTGPAAVYGEFFKRGITAFKQDFPSSNVEIKFEDDHFDPKQTIASYRKLAAENADFVIVCASAPSNAIAPLLESVGVPLLSWASDHSRLASPLAVALFPSGEMEGEKIGAEAVRRGLKRVFAVSTINDYPLSVIPGLRRSLGSELLVSEETAPDTQDFRAILARSRKHNAEAFYICLNPGQLGIFAKQTRQLGFKQPIFGCLNLESPSEVKIAEGALDNAWFVSSQAEPEFDRRLAKQYADGLTTAWSALAYDTLAQLERLHNELVTTKSPQERTALFAESREWKGKIGLLSFREANGVPVS